MDHSRIRDVLSRMDDATINIAWIDAALEEGRKVELMIYNSYSADPRAITIAGEVLQDEILKMVRDNENEELKLYMDELNSLIKEV